MSNLQKAHYFLQKHLFPWKFSIGSRTLNESGYHRGRNRAVKAMSSYLARLKIGLMISGCLEHFGALIQLQTGKVLPDHSGKTVSLNADSPIRDPGNKIWLFFKTTKLQAASTSMASENEQGSLGMNSNFAKTGHHSLYVNRAWLFIFCVLFTTTSCTYVTPEAEDPKVGLLEAGFVMHDGVLSIKKSFFGIETDESKKTVTNTNKKWLCGEAVINQAGYYKNLAGLNYTPRTGHCNLRFQISDDGSALLAREIDPDYSEFENMPLIYSIPITQHYFYEKERDSRGRELNRFGAVTNRSNWQLRPYIDLNLRGMTTFIRSRDRRLGPAKAVIGIGDVEVEMKDGKNYLAFTQTVSVPVMSGWWGGMRHVTLDERVNLLEFQGTPGFKKTPYDDLSVARHMNILHILGKDVDGTQKSKWAAHWDFSEPKEICLNGWPDRYRPIAEEVIDEVNAAFESIEAVPKGQKAFVISTRKPKHFYDLRCPSMTWVADTQLSFRAPLGIGLVNSDISTGEILWGSAIIWGGLIDVIVNRDAKAAESTMAALTLETIRSEGSLRHNPYFMDARYRLKELLEKHSTNHLSLSDVKNFSLIEAGLPDAFAELRDSIKKLTADEIREKQPELATTILNLRGKGLFSADQLDGSTFESSQLDLFSEYDLSKGGGINPEDYNRSLMDYSYLGPSIEQTDLEKEFLKHTGRLYSMYSMTPQVSGDHYGIYDRHNTFEQNYASWLQGTSEMGTMGKGLAAKAIVKFITLHELGHVIGEGHQFEGNRMPQFGTVPTSIYEPLEEAQKKGLNYTSYMDYIHGGNLVNLATSEIKAQPQDHLVLRYLYNQQYTAFDPINDKFQYFEVPANGTIPDRTWYDGRSLETRYMPQCSDLEALTGESPYCRRFDRGSDAATMAKMSVEEYKNGFIARMNSFTGATGGNTDLQMMRLWLDTYELTNDNRTFYDRLRYILFTQTKYKAIFEKMVKAPDAMLAFSKSCVLPSKAPEAWRKEFTTLALESTKNGESSESYLSELNALIETGTFSVKGETVELQGTLDAGLSDLDFLNIEKALHEKGIRFTEVQKLCRATSKALDLTKDLLSVRGPDNPIIDYEAAAPGNGIHSGGSSADFSQIFGAYEQLGLLPVKLSALDLLTSVSSTMSWGPWRLNKPKYSDPNVGKFGYFSFYPKEFTDIVSAAVQNNMSLGGTDLEPVAHMGISNFYMGSFLNRAFRGTNEKSVAGIDSDYLNDLRNQTDFKVSVAAIIMEPDFDDDDETRAFGFKPPKLYNVHTKDVVKLPEGYLLPNGKTIIKGLAHQIIVPISKLRFTSRDSATVWALVIEYDKTSHNDPLQGHTIKHSIATLTANEYDKCADELENFFSKDKAYHEQDNPNGFKGFLISSRIEVDTESQRRYEESVLEAFETYEEVFKPRQKYCGESYKGIELIGVTAMSLNGYVLPQVFDYIKK